MAEWSHDLHGVGCSTTLKHTNTRKNKTLSKKSHWVFFFLANIQAVHLRCRVQLPTTRGRLRSSPWHCCSTKSSVRHPSQCGDWNKLAHVFLFTTLNWKNAHNTSMLTHWKSTSEHLYSYKINPLPPPLPRLMDGQRWRRTGRSIWLSEKKHVWENMAVNHNQSENVAAKRCFPSLHWCLFRVFFP